MEPKFVVDVNVGRLAKWLRAMGYDVLCPWEAEDDELVRIGLREDRIVVTKDGGLAERRVVTTGLLRLVLIIHDDLNGQLRQVIRSLDLNSAQGFSRCIACNEPLVHCPREVARAQVPPYVHETQREFMRCPLCHRVYWRGTHWANMSRELAQLRDGET